MTRSFASPLSLPGGLVWSEAGVVIKLYFSSGRTANDYYDQDAFRESILVFASKNMRP